MTITQTVEVPANHRLIIDVPLEVPTGPVILTFTPAANQRSEKTDDGLDFEGDNLTLSRVSGDSNRTSPRSGGDCPLCAKYRDPETGELPYNAVTLAAMQEARDIADGKIPGTWYHSVEELRKELEI